ncbi:MAG: sulfite exporter TauE/SafE family protein, partial [Desulfobaccales bacterium]
FVLMPVLLLVYPQATPEQLTAISLSVVFFNAVAGSQAYAFMGRIDYKSGLIFAAATIPGAVVGALNSTIVPRHLCNGSFGLRLIAVAAVRILRPEGKPRSVLHTHRGPTWGRVTSAEGKRHYYTFNIYIGVGISFVVGYLSSFLGIGGGIIHVPVLIYFLDFPVYIATATSQFVLAIMALSGTVVHVWHGLFRTEVRHAMSLTIGVLLGAPIGAQLSNRIGGPGIIRILALALGVVGFRILIMYFQH